MDGLAEIDGIGAPQRQNRQVERFRIERRSSLIGVDAEDSQVEIGILSEDLSHVARDR